MEDHHLARAAESGVELHPVGALVEREAERGEGVLRRVAARAPVTEDAHGSRPASGRDASKVKLLAPTGLAGDGGAGVMPRLGFGELLVIGFVLLVVFSASRMSALGNALGKFIYSFKKASRRARASST